MSVSMDFFPDEVGPKGTSTGEEGIQPQMKVLRGFKYHGIDGDLLRAFKVLYPGDIEIMKMNAALVADRHMPTTVGEFFVFLGLILGARGQNCKGRDLFFFTGEKIALGATGIEVPNIASV